MRAFLAALCFALLAPQPAIAHEWYPPGCCSGRDCFPIQPSEVRLLPNGEWEIVLTGEHIRHKGYSPDGEFHRCSWGGDPKQNTICLFIPAPAGS